MLHLGFGESRFPVHPKVAAALVQHVQARSYLPTQGLPELREAVAGFYHRHFGFDVGADQVIVGPGSKSLIYAAQMALGADLLRPTPSWVSYAPQARLLGNRVIPLAASPGNHWELTVDAIEAGVAASGGARLALALNSPNNPTGRMWNEQRIHEICETCRRRGIAILSDEIYALTAHGHQRHRSPAEWYPEGTVVFGGLSKHLSLGGWRLGVAIVPAGAEGRQMMAALRVVAGEVWSSPAAPVQYAGVAAYADDSEIDAYVAECAAIHAVRTRYLWEWLAEYGVPCAEPDGGFYLFPIFDPWRAALAQQGVHTSDDLAHFLLERYQIATLPGSAFGVSPEVLSLRLATSYVDMEDDERAMALLDSWRSGQRSDAFVRSSSAELQDAASRLGQFVEALGPAEAERE